MCTYIKGAWETKDEIVIKIKDMNTKHIENTINFLKKHRDFYDIGGGDLCDPDTFFYEDNSHLVRKKIKELEQELIRRNSYGNNYIK